MYLAYAFLSLIPFVGFTLTNKIATNDNDSLLVCFIKSTLYIITCFILVCIMGNVTNLFSYFIDLKTSLFLLLTCFLSVGEWILYYVSLKISKLSFFNSTYLSSKVLFVNVGNLIFFGSVATNGFNPLNIILFVFSIALLLYTLIQTVVSKDSSFNGSKKWILLLLFSTLLASITVFIIAKFLDVSLISEDIILFYQAIAISIGSFIGILLTKKVKSLKTVSWKTYFILFLSAIFESAFCFLYYKAVNDPSSNVSVVNIISNCGLLVLIEIFVLISKKDKFSILRLTLLITFTLSLILTCLAGYI